MKYAMILSLLIAVSCCWGQTTPVTPGKAETKGRCSPAVSGSNNNFTINCGIDKKQGEEMLAILNKILANKLDTDVVMAKLDEILKAVNPNVPRTVYFCNGEWQRNGPSETAGFMTASGGDNRAFKEMADLYNSHRNGELLTSCLA